MKSRRPAELAAEVLGVCLDGLTTERLAAAYKDLIKTHHPDVGGRHEDFVRLQQAQRELMRWLEGQPAAGACVACGGTGIRKVVRGFSTMTMRCHCTLKEGS